MDGNGGKGWKCSDYATNKWCENGGVGNSLIPAWSWNPDVNGKDARDICCACGGKGVLGELLRKFRKNIIIYCKYYILRKYHIKDFPILFLSYQRKSAITSN